MKLNENYVVKHLANDIILVHQDEYNVDFSKIITLNEIALLIINKIQEGLNLQEITECITNEYDIDKETARKDAEEFINKLIELGIVYE